MLYQVDDSQHCSRSVLCFHIGVSFCHVLVLVELLVGHEALSDGLGGEEFGVASKPIHPVHLVPQCDVPGAELLHHVHTLLIYVSLQE